MNRKQLIVLIVVAAVLGAAGWVLWKRNAEVYSQSSATIGEQLIVDFPINEVTRITIRQSTNEVNLVRAAGGEWVVRERGDFPARLSSIADFLRKIWELKIAKPVTVTEPRLARLELLPPPEGPGTLVEFRGEDGEVIHTLLLGAEHMREAGANAQFGGGWPDGRYVMLNSDLNRVSLIAEPLSQVEPTPSQWLKTDFFKVENASSLSVTFQDAINSWRLTRNEPGGEWTLFSPEAGEELDRSKLSAFSNPLASPSFNDVKLATEENLEEAGLLDPTLIRVETFDGIVYEVRVGEKANNDYFLTLNLTADLREGRTPAEDESEEDKARLDQEFADKLARLKEKLEREEKFEGWIFSVPAWSVDSLLKKRSELLKEKETNAESAEDASGADSDEEVPSAED